MFASLEQYPPRRIVAGPSKEPSALRARSTARAVSTLSQEWTEVFCEPELLRQHPFRRTW